MSNAERDVSIFWDCSNTFYPAREVARDREGPIVARDVRLQFDAVFELARAGRPVVSGMCVGSTSFGNPRVEAKLRSVGIDVEFYERGNQTGTEQAVDQALQVHMLRTLVDRPPGIAVLLTGDGAGDYAGRGYFADLKRMHRGGWDVEVISWRGACHGGMREWAEEYGHFIALDDYYEYVTFLENLRMARKLPPQSRSFEKADASSAAQSTATGTPRS
jgi:hypothetical protein